MNNNISERSPPSLFFSPKLAVLLVKEKWTKLRGYPVYVVMSQLQHPMPVVDYCNHLPIHCGEFLIRPQNVSLSRTKARLNGIWVFQASSEFC